MPLANHHHHHLRLNIPSIKSMGATFAIIGLCTLLYIPSLPVINRIFGRLSTLNTSLCLLPSSWKLYQLWTFGFLHFSPLHLLFNMTAFHQLSLEPQLGSLALLNLVWNLVYIGGLMQFTIAHCFRLLFNLDTLVNQCTAGLSGGNTDLL